MIWTISIKGSAAKSLEKITKTDRIRIMEAIDRLKTNPYAGSVLKGEFIGLRRIRIGHYRVVYEVQEGILMVLVIRIGHRREVYRPHVGA
uniref:mRNA interferase RelE/StbE n=1 Tax=Candidatus Kentrum sp. FW TaxID=2126338 RepID=A0A450TT84_9GAMM|nr:MAG: mRNA interferase RelE/StbE [Candidatus Kentron sp. FW]